MPHVNLLVIPLLSLAGMLLVVERWWRGRLWRRHEELLTEHLDALRRANQGLATQVQAGRQRRRDLEHIVLRLSDALQQHEPGPEERQLLNDVYHEYGTEGHALYFGGGSAADAHG